MVSSHQESPPQKMRSPNTTPRRISRFVNVNVADSSGDNLSSRSLSEVITGRDISSTHHHNNNGSCHDIYASSRRRRSASFQNSFTTGGSSGSSTLGRMDPSSAMDRLRTGMVGNDCSVDDDDYSNNNDGDNNNNVKNTNKGTTATKNNRNNADDDNKHSSSNSMTAFIGQVLHQIPAIAVIGIFHLMVGIPFGVSYFPMNWSSHPEDDDTDTTEMTDDVGKFPIPGKEALGIRMFLFSTLVGQIVFVYFSGFTNPIGLQMVENIGFTKELALVAISHQGYGVDALATVMVMFGLASLLVGIVFFLLGYFKMGKIVYYFPTHVLIGLIGGIGILLCKTGLENTLSTTVSISSLVDGWNHWIIVVILEIVLRLLEYTVRRTSSGDSNRGKQTRSFALLSPIFFCMITPCFYLALFVLKIPISMARDHRYFFPSLSNNVDNDNDMSEFGTPWDLWKVIDFSKVSWIAIYHSFPTMFALVLFSLIHVPINIPAFALSTKSDVDMNNELIAHGVSNMLAGAGGGLQNYMAYTQSVLYDKSGGNGRVSGMAVAALTGILFFVGPDIASHIPRCMAGALLLHVGIDLFLEGVWDSFGKFDLLEYAGIWLIVIVMSLYGMEAAMVMGGIAAVSTYAVQNVAYLSPIRGVMPATTLRSSDWSRIEAAEVILSDSEVGRNRIFVIQLQGHLFFGNMAFFTDQINELLCPVALSKSSEPSKYDSGMGTTIGEENKNKKRVSPIVLIMDCTLVLGIDSSAARAIVKLKDTILNEYNIQLCIFVTGSTEGFPTEFDLRDHLSTTISEQHDSTIDTTTTSSSNNHSPSEDTSLLAEQRQQIQDDEEDLNNNVSQYTGSCVSDSLDLALMEAEDALIAKQNPSLLLEEDDILLSKRMSFDGQNDTLYTSNEEKEEFIHTMKDICPGSICDDDVNLLFLSFERESYKEDELIWKQNDRSDSVKLLILGQLIAELENEAGTKEIVPKGSMIGELGLVNGNPRMSSVKCASEQAIIYSMSRESFEMLVEQQPNLARYIDLICVKYLTLRVQHVSNRIFETRCLPI